MPRDPKGCSRFLQVKTRRRAAKKGAKIIEVYRTAVAGDPPPSGPTTPKRGGIPIGFTEGVKNRIRRERRKKKKTKRAQVAIGAQPGLRHSYYLDYSDKVLRVNYSRIIRNRN